MNENNVNSVDTQVVSIDPVIFCLIKDELNILLMKRNIEPHKDTWALPGGVVNKSLDNSLEEAVERVLLQKTGVEVNYKEQLLSIGGSGIDPRGWTISISYMALIDYKSKLKEGNKWIKLSELNEYYLGFGHHYEIINKAVERLTNKVNYSTLPMHLMKEKFTLPQLQKVYEVLLNEKLDKSSFRKQIENTGLLKDTGLLIKQGPYRPAKLYTIEKEKVFHFKKNMI